MIHGHIPQLGQTVPFKLYKKKHSLFSRIELIYLKKKLEIKSYGGLFLQNCVLNLSFSRVTSMKQTLKPAGCVLY